MEDQVTTPLESKGDGAISQLRVHHHSKGVVDRKEEHVLKNRWFSGTAILNMGKKAECSGTSGLVKAVIAATGTGIAHLTRPDAPAGYNSHYSWTFDYQVAKSALDCALHQRP